MKAALPANEAERLSALRACRVLDTEPEETYDGLTRLAALACGTPFAAVTLVDADRQWFKSVHGLGVRETPRDIAFCAHTILNNDLMVVPDATLDPRFWANPLVTGAPKVRFYAGAPLVTEGGHALGDLCVVTDAHHRIAPAQEDALRTLARQVTGHLERRRPRAQGPPDALAQMTAQLAREREVTATLQHSLLRMPPPRAFPGLDVASLYESATAGLDVGGDFLDAFALDGGRVALVVGDVTGKGLAAAAQTTEVKYVLRGYLSEGRRPADALTRLNAYLCGEGRCDDPPRSAGGVASLICLSLAVVDPAAGRAWAASAGAEPPLIVRASGRAEAAEVAGLPLHALPGAEYAERELSLSPGDLLVMATDGVTEARFRREFLGYGGLTELAIRARRRPSAAQVARLIVNGARDFAAGWLRDDLAVLVARLGPPPV